MQKVIRLLLLGPSESGKTTVVKQMQIIHLNGYTLEELMAMRPYIFANVVLALTQLLQGVMKLGFEVPPDYQEDAEYVLSVANEGGPLNSLHGRLHCAIKRLWESEQVQHAYVRRNEFQLVDCAK
ncbi:guanine nucleotidebinding protein alpha-1 subunit [Aphelenchoides avenae]|nr:guanine nucleotidebinding protein alpha-1 subunit [Aphelenchus avenae]